MSAPTEVELIYIKHRVERWIRFGRPIAERIVDRRRRVLSFAPGSVFAFVRWAANEHGTVVSRIDILRAATPGMLIVAVPSVTPGGDSLVRASGWPRVERVLAAIDQVEALRLLPEDICPDHWRHVHARVTVGLPPRDYTCERHHVWKLRTRVAA